MAFKVKIASKTWIQDNYNLFDYDLNKDFTSKEIMVQQEGTLVRRLDDI